MFVTNLMKTLLCLQMKRIIIYILQLSALSIFLFNTAYADKEVQFSGNDRMNSYSLKDYKDFEKKWKLVSVRYRKDTSEMRFTYANPLAWKTMMSGKSEYPDGSVFAKIGIMSEDDELFPSSSTPSGGRRYQLMIRNKKKHREDDGWGYALFDQNGVTFNEDPKVKIAACVACHKVAASRGFVFSQPMQFAVGEPNMWLHGENKSESGIFFKFEVLKVEKLPTELQKHIPPQEHEVNYLVGPIQKNMFQGTIDEIRPVLVKQTKANKKPSILVSQSGTRYSLVYSVEQSEKCKAEKNANTYRAIFSVRPDVPQAPTVRYLEFCF